MGGESTSSNHPEQVALNRMLEVSYENLKYGLLSANSRTLVWRSLPETSDLVDQYLKATGKRSLTDKRRRLTQKEQDFVDAVWGAAYEATAYRDWAINRENRQPVIRDALISACTAFEAFLKSVAIVFGIANVSTGALSAQVFVPSETFTKVRRRIEKGWKNEIADGEFRAKAFFGAQIEAANPAPDRFILNLSSDAWADCQAGFKLRNAIVHQLARPSEQIELGPRVFHPGWEIDLDVSDIALVRRSMQIISYPFDPEPL